MFKFLSQLFNVKSKIADFEAKLLPIPGCTYGGVGEVEVEAWSDGTSSLDASVKHSGFPNGSELEVCIGGARVANLVVSNGYGKQWLSTRQGDVVPSVQVGDEAELRYQGQVLYRGSFRRD